MTLAGGHHEGSASVRVRLVHGSARLLKQPLGHLPVAFLNGADQWARVLYDNRQPSIYRSFFTHKTKGSDLVVRILTYIEVGDADVGAAPDEHAADVGVSGRAGGGEGGVAAQRVGQVDAHLGHVEEELEHVRVALSRGDDERLLGGLGEAQLRAAGEVVARPVARQQVADRVQVAHLGGVEQGARAAVVRLVERGAALHEHAHHVAVAALRRQAQRRDAAVRRRAAAGAELEQQRNHLDEALLGVEAEQRAVPAHLRDVVRRRARQKQQARHLRRNIALQYRAASIKKSHCHPARALSLPHYRTR